MRIGDILLHDTGNGNKLTVYRGGEIVKAITQTSLGMAALLKQGFITEVVAQHPTAASASPRASEAPKKGTPATDQKDSLRKEIKRKAKAATQEPEANES